MKTVTGTLNSNFIKFVFTKLKWQTEVNIILCLYSLEASIDLVVFIPELNIEDRVGWKHCFWRLKCCATGHFMRCEDTIFVMHPQRVEGRSFYIPLIHTKSFFFISLITKLSTRVLFREINLTVCNYIGKNSFRPNILR